MKITKEQLKRIIIKEMYDNDYGIDVHGTLKNLGSEGLANKLEQNLTEYVNSISTRISIPAYKEALFQSIKQKNYDMFAKVLADIAIGSGGRQGDENTFQSEEELINYLKSLSVKTKDNSKGW